MMARKKASMWRFVVVAVVGLIVTAAASKPALATPEDTLEDMTPAAPADTTMPVGATPVAKVPEMSMPAKVAEAANPVQAEPLDLTPDPGIPVRITVEANTVEHPEAVKRTVYADAGAYTVLPSYERSREEEAAYLRNSSAPQMVEKGHFQNELCKQYHNCTQPPMVDEQAPPGWAPPGSISEARSEDIEARMKEALLMRWDSVSMEVLSHLEQQRQVCGVIAGLQPIADFVISSGTQKDINQATTLFELVCPRVKKIFPSATKNLDCKNLHAKTIEYSRQRHGLEMPLTADPKRVFEIGSCCNCTTTSGLYDTLKAKLEVKRLQLEDDVHALKQRTDPEQEPVVANPEIVEKLHTAGVRYYDHEGEQAKPGDVLRMKAVSQSTSQTAEATRQPPSLRRRSEEQQVITPDLYSSYVEGRRVKEPAQQDQQESRRSDDVADAEVEALRVEADQLDEAFNKETASFAQDSQKLTAAVSSF